MNKRQEKFCKYYVETQNPTEASLKAGYKKNDWKRLLQNENIKKCIDLKMKKLSNNEKKMKKLSNNEKKMKKPSNNENVSDGDEVIKCLTSIMRGSIEICEKESPKEVGIKEKLKAAELLGKVYSIFSSKQETDEKPIIIYGGDEVDD